MGFLISVCFCRVFEAHEADMTTAKALSQDRLKGHVVRLRGLPYNASASDGKFLFIIVVAMFQFLTSRRWH